MSIDFNRERWERVTENYSLWWEGKLTRPLIHITVDGRDPGRSEPALPYRSFTAFYESAVHEADIVDRWDYQLSQKLYLGDAFPAVFPNFGPGAIGAFLGARTRFDADTVWFLVDTPGSITELELAYNTQHEWLQRIEKLCNLATGRWEGLVQVSMTDLGGTLDVLSIFRPGELLLLDLYDAPEAVTRLTWQVHHLWWQFFERIQACLLPENPGYTAWAPIFSMHPYYMLQCDFCYMLSPDLFQQYVEPELRASCRRLVHPFYHLDGPGALAHLDSLLAIEELKGIQWVPGDGQPDQRHWPEVYQRIHDAGKLIQLFGEIDVLDAVAGQLGGADGIIYIGSVPRSRLREAQELLEKYDCCT